MCQSTQEWPRTQITFFGRTRQSVALRWNNTSWQEASECLRTKTSQKKPIFTNLKKRFEHIELPAKLLDYFLRSNKSNINQSLFLQKQKKVAWPQEDKIDHDIIISTVTWKAQYYIWPKFWQDSVGSGVDRIVSAVVLAGWCQQW